ncbi:MAG: sporulation protein YabP [Clostridia bacterium]|nr:sporulation protein YabP [Clostridia bacterium]
MNQSGTSSLPHAVSLAERTHLQISGVCEVISFDEACIALRTVCGSMTVEGSEMHITTLNIDRGEVIVDGKINGLFYTGDGSEKHGFWGRLFS